MKMIFPYYEVDATLRYGTKPWRELPHVYLANMAVPEDIYAFTKAYGPLFRGSEIDPDVNANFMREAQDVLRKAWANDESALRRLVEGEPQRPTGQKIDLGHFGAGYTHHTFERFHLSVTETGLEIEADDLWAFMQLAFLRDHSLGKAQICSNPPCETPYFLQSKRGQIYCSHRCAVAANVRRFREGKNFHATTKKVSKPAAPQAARRKKKKDRKGTL